MLRHQYLICLSVDPVQFDFIGCNLPDDKHFQGFNSFNQYFDILAPDTNAKAIPDVWDGYYRITLAQFESTTSPEKMRDQFKSFRLTSSNASILLDQPFRTWKLGVSPSVFRLGHDFAHEPIALYVTRPSGFPFDSVLKRIQDQIKYSDWTKIPERWLHMNIRLYSNATNGNWTWQNIKRDGIPAKVSEHTIEFHHTTLQIIPSRETCKKVYDNRSSHPWWMGVTVLNGKCSGCRYTVKESEWEGVCPSCNEYERIKPIWSIPCSTQVSNFVERKSVFAYLERGNE
jgi:hypothetical protein